MPWIAFVFLMGHMSVNHLNRQFINAPDRVDITGKWWALAGGVDGCLRLELTAAVAWKERKWFWL